MASKNFYRLTEALLPDWPDLSPVQKKQLAFDCADSVKTQIAIAPQLVRVGLGLFYSVIVFCFYLSAPLKGLDIPVPQRKMRLAKTLKLIPPLSLFIKAMQSLILLRYMEHPIIKPLIEGRGL
jgi:hypothetical protein